MYPERTLGTANFVNPYGLNRNGLSKNDINNLLKCAWDNEFIGIDTAAEYFSVQEVLSEVKSFVLNDWRLTTKIPKRKEKESLINYEMVIKNFIENTRKILKKDTIDTVLVHDPNILRNKDEMDMVSNLLLNERNKGHLSFLGFSIYNDLSCDEMHSLSKSLNEFTLQCPYSIFDRRFEESISKYSNFCSFQIRSIFLQGLLLNQNYFENKFKQSNAYKSFKTWLNKNNLTSFEACVSFAKYSKAKELVIGFNSTNELEEFGEMFDKVKEANPLVFCTDEQVLNPLNW